MKPICHVWPPNKSLHYSLSPQVPPVGYCLQRWLEQFLPSLQAYPLEMWLCHSFYRETRYSSSPSIWTCPCDLIVKCPMGRYKMKHKQRLEKYLHRMNPVLMAVAGSRDVNKPEPHGWLRCPELQSLTPSCEWSHSKPSSPSEAPRCLKSETSRRHTELKSA